MERGQTVMRRHDPRPGLRRFLLAVLLASAGALTGPPAGAFEPPPGSKNFTPPNSVPNYFSNEATAFRGGARPAPPGADRFNTAPNSATSIAADVPRYRRGEPVSAGRAKHRGKLVRGRTGRFRATSAHTRAARIGKARTGRAAIVRAAARPAAGKAAAAHRRAAVRHPRRTVPNLRHTQRTTRHAPRTARGRRGSAVYAAGD
jgi:hypothetical protein